MHKTENEKNGQLKSYADAVEIIADLFEKTDKKDLEKAMKICGIGMCEGCSEKGNYFREGEITARDQAEEQADLDRDTETQRVNQIFENIKKEIEQYEE